MEPAWPSALTVEISDFDRRFTLRARRGLCPLKDLDDRAYDLAVVRFTDEGMLVDDRELAAAATRIEEARSFRDASGAVVVLFIHGWHHNANWDHDTDQGDPHFQSFRRVLAALALREAERPDGRRVVGVYVGWKGERDGALWGRSPLSYLTFRNRYQVARKIGGCDAMRRVVRAIVYATKGPASSLSGSGPRRESPLVLIGHSMGALMLESAFLALLRDMDEPLVHHTADEVRVVKVLKNGQPVSFPDVLIALNSAAESRILREIQYELSRQKLTKSVGGPGYVSYHPPLLISATSATDLATKWLWPAANFPRLMMRTDGHDRSLFTHTFRLYAENSRCDLRLDHPDFGQNWHCLRSPTPEGAPTPFIAVDLPGRERAGVSDKSVPFSRYRLEPRDLTHANTTWVFQLPDDLVDGHNDIFNPKASSLILSLIQMSGAIMSLAKDWNDTFEPETSGETMAC
jgi:hypothetical protein